MYFLCLIKKINECQYFKVYIVTNSKNNKRLL